MKKGLTLTAFAILFAALVPASAFADQRDFRGTDRDGWGYGHRIDRDRELRGLIDRVNRRLGYMIVREADGDFVKVDMRPVRRMRREPDLDDLHRGEVIAIRGEWRDGLFRAERVDRIRRSW